ncbi:MAG: tetratricopeptide repeat protein [Gammaproteobacteria bacterium]|nr:tetratricopeptide repeat protein [Gammaproteobacteria bacterium]
MRFIQALICSTFLLQMGSACAQVDELATVLQQADTQAKAGQLDQAIRTYNNLISQHPSQPEIYNNLAVLLAKQGKLDAARETLEKAMRQNPVYATVYDNLSAVYVEMARGSYAKALQLGMAPREVALKSVDVNPVVTKPVTVASAKQTKAGVVERNVSSEQAKAEKPLDFDSIKMTLHGWASAWSAQEVDLYLSFYAADFKPGKNLQRHAWAKQRRVRLKKPEWVKVTLDNIQIEAIEQDRISARFIQEYQSNSYNDITHKEVQLQSSPDGWRILAETAL